METLQIRKQLLNIFEPELVDEILDNPFIVESAVGTVLGEIGSQAQFIPIVVKGSVRSVRFDENGNEIFIYNIEPIQSCILTVTAVMQESLTKTIGIANEDVTTILIPREKAEPWMAKYSSWRHFTINLYEKRLNELLQQHQLVSEQKERISKQKKSLTDSIQYARRIQNAVLPPMDLIKSLLPEHFILFKPRNIVSGDYYWLTQIENKTILAVADCTGHGVPGAFMSMLGISLLNQVVGHNKNISVNEILNEMRDAVKKSLRQTGKSNEAKDGMDMVVVIFDRETQTLEYAGANNPIYIVRNKELIELKPDKMPIGVHVIEDKMFTKNEFSFQNGDAVYAFSDGFADQVGGNARKKFMSKNFKQLLTDISENSMEKQREMLNETIENWRGDEDQVDDILVVGVRC